MVKLGKMMWKLTVKANWRRASRTGSRSIGQFPAVVVLALIFAIKFALPG
jgi:hypothetical protein